MATIIRFEELEIWQVSRELYNSLSKIVTKLKKEREYRFAEQIRSAAGSVMDNIAEGFERNSRLEFLNSLTISKGECGELKSQLYRLLDGSFISNEEFETLYEQCDKVSRKIANFVKYLNNSDLKGLKFKGRADTKR